MNIEHPTDAYLGWISSDGDLIDEMKELCQTAGYRIVHSVTQRRSKPDPRFYLGPGKLEEFSKEEGIDHLIIARELTPAQMYNISSATGMKVLDRTRIILDIFRSRAYSPEARLQIEIADLKYQMPLMREYIHQGKLSERPGFMAGGEYKIDYYYELSKKRISQLRKEMEVLRRKRGLRRRQRSRKGVHTVSIAGYTNAGKSTLMNQMMEPLRDSKTAEKGELMFTTVSTTTRSMKGRRNCIITDTVGFISNLPPWLVEGFMSTLEEIFSSEIVLLVIDASDPLKTIKRKIEDSLAFLMEGGVKGKVIIVLNKKDIAGGLEEKRSIITILEESKKAMISAVMGISAMEGDGIDGLMKAIEENLPPLRYVSFSLPYSNTAVELVSDIRKGWKVDISNDDHGNIIIEGEIEDRFARSFMKKVVAAGGTASVNEALGVEKP